MALKVAVGVNRIRFRSGRLAGGVAVHSLFYAAGETVPMPKKPTVTRPFCGTVRGEHAHRKRGEVPCEQCKAARAAYMRDYRAGEDLRAHRCPRVTAGSIRRRQMDQGRAFLAMSDEALAALAAEQEKRED